MLGVAFNQENNMSDAFSRSKNQMVTGLFPDRDSAESAYQAVTERGYSRDDVNLIMSDDARARHFAATDGTETELGSKAAQGAGIGGAIGGSLGALVAAIAAVGTSLVVPGLGLVVAGPLAAAIAGAGAGGATGGIIGALIGYGIPEERVEHYEEGIRKGGILMGVTPRSDDDAMHFENKFKESKGEHVIGTGLGAGAGALTGAAIGLVAGPIGTAGGAVVGAITGGLAGKGAAEVVNPDAGDDLTDHNLGKGVGASGGAMAGAAVGAVGGPIGMAAGAAIGAVAGGLAGHGAGAVVNPAAEDSYWRGAHQSAPHALHDYSYDDYAPAYQLGYNSRAHSNGAYETSEPQLRSQWETAKGSSRLTWEQAKDATRAAWNRVT